MSWRLRKSKKTIYGPVELPELRYWAADGRVAPADEISENGGDWKPAADLPDLELNWLLTRPDGTAHGPLHIRVCTDLLHRNILRSDEPLLHRTTGERTTLANAIALELLRHGNAPLAPQPQAKETAPEPAPATAPATGPVLKGADRTTLEEALRNTEFQNERLRARNIELSEEIAALNKTLAELKNSASGSDDKLNELAATRDRLQAQLDELNKRLAQLKDERDAALRDLRDLNARYIQLRDEASAANPAKPKIRLA